MIKETGVIEDTRSEEEKEKAWRHEEIASGVSTPTWVPMAIDSIRKFPQFLQDGSLSCVANGHCKALGVENLLETGEFINLSRKDFYWDRANRPGGGMHGADANRIGAKRGATLEERVRSQNLGESAMNTAYMIGDEDVVLRDKFRAAGYVEVNPTDTDTLAYIIQNTRKVIPIFIYFTEEEWNAYMDIRVPNLGQYENRTLRHCVTLVEPFLYNGEQCFMAEDSANEQTTIGGNGQRIIPVSFLKKRCYYASYYLPRPNPATVIEKPKYNFIKPLVMESKDKKTGMYIRIPAQEKDVVVLQNILKYEGFFPKETESTGRYLQITAQGVRKFQTKYAVTSTQEIALLAGKNVGPKTRAKLNELYN